MELFEYCNQEDAINIRNQLLLCEECLGQLIISVRERVSPTCATFYDYLPFNEKLSYTDWLNGKSVHKPNRWLAWLLIKNAAYESISDKLVYNFMKTIAKFLSKRAF